MHSSAVTLLFRVRTAVLMAGCVAFVCSCSTQNGNSWSRTRARMSAIQLRAMQTRQYDGQDYLRVMKAAMHTLQDDGYIIKNAETELGLLVAERDVPLPPPAPSEVSSALGIAGIALLFGSVVGMVASDSKEGKKRAASVGQTGNSLIATANDTRDAESAQVYPVSSRTEITVNITEVGPHSNVRISMAHSTMYSNGVRADPAPCVSPEHHQETFSKLDKALFIARQGL